jgi:hypothetical protein
MERVELEQQALKQVVQQNHEKLNKWSLSSAERLSAINSQN